MRGFLHSDALHAVDLPRIGRKQNGPQFPFSDSLIQRYGRTEEELLAELPDLLIGAHPLQQFVCCFLDVIRIPVTDGSRMRGCSLLRQGAAKRYGHGAHNSQHTFDQLPEPAEALNLLQ